MTAHLVRLMTPLLLLAAPSAGGAQSAPAVATTPDISIPSTLPPGVVRDPLLEYRRKHLPPALPWPVSFFQPQAAVEGRPGTPLRPAPAAQRTISDAAIQQAQAYADQEHSTALLIYRDGRLEYEHYAPSTGPDTITHSYHMQYTALVMLVGMAIADGKIASLDEPAATYLPEWRNDARSRITIRNLLQQNAGLDMRFDAHHSDGMYSRDARAYWGSRTKDVLVREYNVVHPAGTVFDYNYAVPELLSIILARATGMPYERYLSERLWKPLGNKRAYLWLNRPGGEAHVDAGLFSTPTDWLNVGILLLQDGKWRGRQLVPASFIAEMRRPSATNPNFGFMWLGSPFAPARRLATDKRVTYTVHSVAPFAAADVSYIDGYGGQRAYVVPSRGLVVVRMGDVARDWDNSRLVNIVLGGIDGGPATARR